MRRGVAELDGQGEVAGGVVILRSGKNAREAIAAVKDKLADKLAELKSSLPPDVEVVTTYDHSQLIDRAGAKPFSPCEQPRVRANWEQQGFEEPAMVRRAEMQKLGR